jgi:hypothetical protein
MTTGPRTPKFRIAPIDVARILGGFPHRGPDALVTGRAAKAKLDTDSPRL